MKLRNLWLEAVAGADASAAVSLPVDPAVEAPPIEEEVTQLFDDLRAPVLRYLISLGLPVADGDEVVQEAFLALFHHLRRGRPRTNLRGWVFRTARNQALKRRLHDRRHTLVAWDAESAEPADQAPNPEQQAASRQRHAKLLMIARALPEQDRSCLNLRAEGLSYREIAEVLGISLGAVSISIQRSLARLSRGMGKP